MTIFVPVGKHRRLKPSRRDVIFLVAGFVFAVLVVVSSIVYHHHQAIAKAQRLALAAKQAEESKHLPGYTGSAATLQNAIYKDFPAKATTEHQSGVTYNNGGIAYKVDIDPGSYTDPNLNNCKAWVPASKYKPGGLCPDKPIPSRLIKVSYTNTTSNIISYTTSSDCMNNGQCTLSDLKNITGIEPINFGCIGAFSDTKGYLTNTDNALMKFFPYGGYENVVPDIQKYQLAESTTTNSALSNGAFIFPNFTLQPGQTKNVQLLISDTCMYFGADDLSVYWHMYTQ